MSSVAGGIDGIEAVFDDGSLVADAGLLLAGTVMSRLGLEALIDDTVRLGGLAGAGAGRKVLSLVASMLVGGRCIDDTDRLRSGASGAVLGFGVVAPSTAGSFLRSFTFGHVRQLDKAAEHALARAWSVGAAPDAGEMTVDLDSTVCEVCGKAKQGAAYMAIPRCWAITRWWRCEQTPARCCTLGCGRGPLSAATSTSLVRPWRGCGAWRATRA